LIIRVNLLLVGLVQLLFIDASIFDLDLKIIVFLLFLRLGLLSLVLNLDGPGKLGGLFLKIDLCLIKLLHEHLLKLK